MIVGTDKFYTFLGKPQQIKIPIYQRKYSWEKKQWEQLFEDVKNVGESGKKTHFIGSLVYTSYVTSIPTIVVIDGQQRITTLSLLIAALANCLIETPSYKELVSFDPKFIVDEYLFNVNRTGEMKYKLLLTDDDDTVYKKIVDNILSKEKFILTDDDKKNGIYEAYEYFNNKIDEENIESLWRGILKLQIVFLNLEEGKEDSPQEIFESLNSTAKTLLPTDLIRNFILMDLDPDEQNLIYNEYWRPIEKVFEQSGEKFDEFIKNYLTIKKDNWVSNDVYGEFKKFKGETDILTLVKDVQKYWEYFKKIVLYEEKNDKLKQSFKSINQLPYKIVRPFLMRLYEDYEQGDLSQHDFIEIINYTESYLLRRTICDRDSQSIKGFFDRMHKILRDENFKPNGYLEYYKSILGSRIGKTSMPDDDEFEYHFTNVDLYNKKNIRKYVLLKLNNYETNDLSDFKRCTIEHIMPQNQNLSEDWRKELGEDWEEVHTNYLHVLGNLTLTSSNSEIGDKPFMKKRTMQKGYDKSNYNLNKYFKDNDITKWDREEIIERGNYLFKIAKEIWKLPETLETKGKNNTPGETMTLDSFGKPNVRYWTMCKQQINNFSPIFNTNITPKDSSDFYLSINSALANISLKINTKTKLKEVKTQLIIKDKELYNYLEKQKPEIKSELKLDLIWENLETNKSSTITVVTDEFDLDDDLEWNKSIKWQIDKAEMFYNAFHDRIQDFKKIHG